MKLAIIADDFTGANDVALQLSKYGIDIVSLLNLENIPEYFVYSTETRNVKEMDAQTKLMETFDKIRNIGADKIYKKIDSTLRGNVKIELEEFLKILEEKEKIAVILPFPKLNRVVKNGKLYINNTELIDTEYSKDVYWKLSSSNVLDYFGGELITLEEIRTKNLDRIIKEKINKVIVFEAETEEDMKKIAKSLVETNYDKNILGSSGIMEYLLEIWGYKKKEVLIISGSCNPINIKQTEIFIEKVNPTIYDYYVDEDKLEITKGKNDYILRTIRAGEKRSDKDLEDIKSKISKISKTICEEKNINKVVLSGGDITIAFMNIFKLEGLKVISEIETGVGYGEKNEWQIITKSGGYGSENIYVKAYEYIKNHN